VSETPAPPTPLSQAPRAGRPRRARASKLLHLARALVHDRLRRTRCGELVLVEDGRETAFGTPDAEPRARVEVRDPALYRALALRGPLGGAEAFLDGHWDSPDPAAVVRVLAANRDVFDDMDRGAARLARPGLRLLHALRRNTRAGSRRNVAAHYDLGNDFFACFLDRTLTYSCGIFEREEADLEEAQVAKYERVCRKLELGPGDHVLEVGGGWGGFAIHAAKRYGCRVTTTTVSRAQHELARERVAEARLEDRVEVVCEDYRDLCGRYDKLVSIEMIEAVGADHWEAFFRACSERLRPDGALLLQAIGVPERDLASSLRSVDFVKRHVFPGGQLVSVGAICRALARATDLRVAHMEELTPHYAETLRRWRARFRANRETIRAQGFPERFLRLWEFYLAYCEGGFAERANVVFQMVLEKPLGRRSWLGAGA